MLEEAYQLKGNAAEIYEAQKVKAIFGPLARATLEVISLSRDEKVLDLACGTGIVARTVHEVSQPLTTIADADLNPGMIAKARELTTQVQGDFDWHVADAGDLPFDDGAFTAVFCQQGIQFFPHEKAAVGEARRVMKSGGQFFLTVWKGPNVFFTSMAAALSRHVSPDVGERSLAPFGYARLPQLMRLLESSGFADVSSQTIKVDRVVSDPERSIEMEILGNPVGPAVRERGADTMRAIVAEIRNDCHDFQRGSDLVIPQESFLISARAI
jgi:ubiquinone/menaquinone biosynthesis C-methylase UbiE